MGVARAALWGVGLQVGVARATRWVGGAAGGCS